METPEGRRSITDWQCVLDQTRGENIFAGTQMQETKFADRLARSARGSPSTKSSTRDPI